MPVRSMIQHTWGWQEKKELQIIITGWNLEVLFLLKISITLRPHLNYSKLESGAYWPTVHTNLSQKRRLSKTLFKLQEFQKYWLFIFVWTKNILKTDFFENNNFTCTIVQVFQIQIQIGQWVQIPPVCRYVQDWTLMRFKFKFKFHHKVSSLVKRH